MLDKARVEVASVQQPWNCQEVPTVCLMAGPVGVELALVETVVEDTVLVDTVVVETTVLLEVVLVERVEVELVLVELDRAVALNW